MLKKYHSKNSFQIHSSLPSFSNIYITKKSKILVYVLQVFQKERACARNFIYLETRSMLAEAYEGQHACRHRCYVILYALILKQMTISQYY